MQEFETQRKDQTVPPRRKCECAVIRESQTQTRETVTSGFLVLLLRKRLTGPQELGEVRSLLAPAALLVGVEIGG